MTWHVARSLNVLLEQINALYPNRDKASDGSIGDAAHASRDSDHNPWYNDTVTARDFTHDPDGGLSCHWLAQRLIASNDARIKYIIWDHRIWTPGIAWSAYNGPNPHTKHLHLSVVASPLCERSSRWDLGVGTTGGFLMSLSDKEQDDLYAAVKELRTKVRNIEQFVEPPDEWTVRTQWIATALSAVRNKDLGQGGDTVRERLDQIGKQLDALKTYVEGLQ